MRQLYTLGLALLIGGCGVAYHSPVIRDGVVDGGKVRVIDVTPETVFAANRDPYQPRALPAAFHQTAGSGGGSPVAEAGPETAFQPETRPEELVARLPPPVPPEPYRIGVGDVVLLATKTPGTSVEELTGLLAAENRRQGYTVQDDGSIAIPDVGRVRIAEMTLEEAEAVLFQRLLERQIDPSFSLEIADFNARKVSIGGAVAQPGVARITLIPLTLDNALAAVGGITAADRDAAVIRIYRDGSLYEIPVRDFLVSPRYQKLRLIDRDSVFVDTEYDLGKAQAYFAEQIQLREFEQGSRQNEMQILTQATELRRGELAEERENFSARVEMGAEPQDYVYLSGEMFKQGRWSLPYGQVATLADALYQGGGGAPNRTADPRQIYVLRSSTNPLEFSGITAWHVDGSSAVGMMMLTRLELRPRDIVFVSEQPVTRWSRVIEQLSPNFLQLPGAYSN
ncbi:polysaccharide export outer membrane protein [Amaricoccus macauensis]|uniref:Polysaccharide export outer membrane protein n=1 Tax=Amaricoccus macauensis TaxID=57001 RepID=A0A840SQN5_9RHOB|nr:polysaccharide biosynthesis/export family protein [Amaricoccus macauensis]MBB5223070.1 polysaccharide export outer membrane protein [Amaricoccus macauensis]